MSILSKNNYLLKQSFKVFFIATLLTSIVSVVNNMLDSIIVSHLVSSDAMTIVTLAIPPSLFAMLVVMLLHSGALYLSTMALGKNDIEKLSLFFSLDIIFTAIVGTIFCTFVLSFVPEISSFITTEERLLGMMTQYISMENVTVTLRCISSVFKSYICVLGHPQKVSISVIVETIVNLIFDFLLCGPLDLGCMGASLATSIAIVISTAQLLPCFRKCNINFVNIYKIKFEYLIQSLKASSPVILGFILIPITEYVSNLYIQKSLGVDGIYVFSILLQIFSFCGIITSCCANSLRNLGGILWGEGDYWSFRALFHLTFKLSIAASFLTFLIVFAFPEILFTLYGASESLSNAQAGNVRTAAVIIIPQGILVLLGVLYYIQGYHTFCIFINTVSTLGSAALIIGICHYCPEHFWSIYPLGYWAILIVILLSSFVNRRNRHELEKFTLIPVFSEKPSVSCSVRYTKDSVNEALNKLQSFVDIVETDNGMMIKIALEELLFTILELNTDIEGNDKYFDVRIVDSDDHLDISVKDCGIPYNPIVQYSDNDIASLDQTNLRFAILGRVCNSSISYEYMNGVNCTFLKFDIIRSKTYLNMNPL